MQEWPLLRPGHPRAAKGPECLKTEEHAFDCIHIFKCTKSRHPRDANEGLLRAEQTVAGKVRSEMEKNGSGEGSALEFRCIHSFFEAA